jgi:transposase
VRDRLELHGWQVEIADAHTGKGLAPLACTTDRVDAWVLAELAGRDLVPAIWLPGPLVRAERERARWRLRLVRHRSSLKRRVHAVLLTQGTPCPVSDLVGVRGRRLLARFGLPEPWQGTIEASLRLIDALDREINECAREPRRLGADHRCVRLLLTVPGIGWALASTIAAEIGDIRRFASPSSPATAAAAHASTNQVNAICAGRSPSRVGATCAGRWSRPPPTPARRPSATNASPRQAPPTPWPPDGP